MLDLYDGYTSTEDRENAIMLESAAIDMDKAVFAYQACQKMEDLKCREAELQTCMEGGNIETLMDYYEDAKSETAPKKESLLQTIWGKILSFIEKMRNYFQGKGFVTDLQIKKSQEEQLTAFQKFQQKWKNVMTKPGIKIVGLIAALGALFVTINAIKKKKTGTGLVTLKKSKAVELKKNLDQTTNAVESYAKDPNNKTDDAEGNKGKLAQLYSKLMNFVNSLLSVLLKPVNAIGAKRRAKNTTGIDQGLFDAVMSHAETLSKDGTQPVKTEEIRKYTLGYAANNNVKANQIQLKNILAAVAENGVQLEDAAFGVPMETIYIGIYKGLKDYMESNGTSIDDDSYDLFGESADSFDQDLADIFNSL